MSRKCSVSTAIFALATVGAALHQGFDAASEHGEKLRVAGLLDSLGVEISELRRAGKQPASGDRQQRPELHEVVLHRRAGDGELEGAASLRAHW